jgi:cytochrome c peroxidase
MWTVNRIKTRHFYVIPAVMLGISTLLISACKNSVPPAEPPSLVELGEQIFLNETFEGNGRTCGTCHRPTDNFGLTPSFIATLAEDDPLFIAEIKPELAENFENPKLMREFAVILENQDGFSDLENNFNMRGVPHTLALGTSIESPDGPRTGWSGDGAPGDGSLRSFAIGAVIQHFTKSTSRIAGIDFRLPTNEELDAMEAFQLSLGRQEEITLPMPLRSVVVARGQEIFLDNALGKCNACHFNAGANGNPSIFGPNPGNLNFNTGIEQLPDQPAKLTTEKVPLDDGFGNPGNGEFNTPTLVEAADTGPFFHNNSVETIEGAVAFYNGDAFTNSPAGALLAGATGSAINLDGTQVVAVAAFLRVINSLENIRNGIELLEQSKAEKTKADRRNTLYERALTDADDGLKVLEGAGLHPKAVASLLQAHVSISQALSEKSDKHRVAHVNEAITAFKVSRELMSG